MSKLLSNLMVSWATCLHRSSWNRRTAFRPAFAEPSADNRSTHFSSISFWSISRFCFCCCSFFPSSTSFQKTGSKLSKAAVVVVAVVVVAKASTVCCRAEGEECWRRSWPCCRRTWRPRSTCRRRHRSQGRSRFGCATSWRGRLPMNLKSVISISNLRLLKGITLWLKSLSVLNLVHCKSPLIIIE